MFMSFARLSETTAINSPFPFATGARCVFCAVRANFYMKHKTNFMLGEVIEAYEKMHRM
jgi:hypothetical protein